MICPAEKIKNDVDSIPTYSQGTEERFLLKQEMKFQKSNPIQIPLIINGKEIFTDLTFEVKTPHDHAQILAIASLATKKEISLAIKASLEAHAQWSLMDPYHRAAIFKKAAEILSGPRRIENIAAIMLNQSKTPYEAEIDLAEMIDFLNFNAKYMVEIYGNQPENFPGEENRFDWRPLEGFIFAIPPFNFYSIGGNLPTAPALMGNVVIWKPAKTVIYANYKIMQALIEAGLPPGVINFLPFNSQDALEILTHPQLAGIHFTGSYNTLITIWQQIGQNLPNYKNFPRIVGETGGKDFIFMHESANSTHTAMNIIRGAFEYQGQKCSAASRAYIPKNRWNEIKQILIDESKKFKFGDIASLEVAGGSIIDEKAFFKIKDYLQYAKNHPEKYDIIIGGNCNDQKGWFVEPTIILSRDAHAKLMEEEIFGPVLTIYLYEPEKFEETLHLCDQTSPYALTGSIFAKDRNAIIKAEEILRYSAGNFYINDKPTGAVVGRQPFGGSRASGTNDKAGSKLNLFRWIIPRTIKENHQEIQDWHRNFQL